MGRLDGKVSIITGGAAGMGASHAQGFLNEGATVVLTDIDQDAGEQLVEELDNSRARFLHHDVASESGWQHVVDETMSSFGRVDVLVNNAGIGGIKHIVDMSVSEYMRVIEVDQLSIFISMQMVAPIMKDQGGGSIINISSVSGFNGSIGGAAYTSAKYAVRGLTQTAALEFGPYGIRVNSVHPGIIETTMFDHPKVRPLLDEFGETLPMRRFGQAQEVTEAVLFLASDASSYFTGAELVVDGGMTATSHVFSDWNLKRQGLHFSATERLA
ncbi:SDR family NAD(P)-dependent oxidoreductase [Ilumatobacter nonamiensis]|uniref:SDR family NAD(P)-dependent oxidoreductase n=1 Tax=Ilumatobacter nonamiensis TaxID=467093 RepID=UPI0003467627|nr:glucose 1-dehydrogenase [Ilumatobacter nonamiensis]